MAELLDDVSYLSQEIGPRPAGTEEEQQAALYIADKVHERTGFHAEIEDIRCMAYSELVDCIYFGAATILLALAFFLPVTSIVAFILSAVVAVLFFIERVQKRPILGRVLTRDISQNVVVKYKPGTTAAQSAHPRKIVVVANYDSGRVRRDASPRLVGLVSFLNKAAAASLVATPLLILLRNIVLAGSLGVVNALFTLLCVIALVFLVAQLAILLVHRLGTFNEAANNNASSVAVMLEVLRRIDGTAAPENAPRTREVAASEPVVHGPEQAAAAGVVPDGAELSYDEDLEAGTAPEPVESEPLEAAAAPVEEPAPQQPAAEDDSAAARLRSAKAAIAALTGEAVDDAIFLDLDEKRAAAAASATQAASFLDRLAVDPAAGAQAAADDAPADEQPAEPIDAQADEPEAAEPAAEPELPAESSVPAWYLAAQAKANRPVDMPVRRSRYADDAEAVARERQQRQQRANALVDEQTEERLRQMRESFAAPAEPEKPVEEPAVEPVADELPVEVQPVVAEQPELLVEDLEVTASFPPVGDKGETVAFEPEFEMDEELEAQAVKPVFEPQPAEDDVIEVEDFEEVIEVPLDLIEEDDEYDGYADDDEPAEAYDDYEEDDEDYEEEPAGFLGRFGIGRREKAADDEVEKPSLFARLRNAIMPEDDVVYPEDEQPEEPEQEAGYREAYQEPLAEESAPAAWAGPDAGELTEEPVEGGVEAEGEPEAYEDEEYYDEEPSRFEAMRDRMSGAFSRFTSRIAPPPNYDEEDYSYEEDEAYEPLAGYEEPPAEEPAYEGQPEAPAYEPADEEVSAYVAEEAPAPAEEPEAAYDYAEPAAPVSFQEPEPPLEAYEEEAPVAPVYEEPATDAYPQEEEGYLEDEGFERPPAQAYDGQQLVDDYDGEDDYDEWEDEEPERGGFFQRVSGFWNRLVGRDDDERYDEESYDDLEDDYEEEGEAWQAAEEQAAQPVDAPAADLEYQTAYAPRRVAPKSYAPAEPEDDYEAEPQAVAVEPEAAVVADEPQPVFEPEFEPEFEPADEPPFEPADEPAVVAYGPVDAPAVDEAEPYDEPADASEEDEDEPVEVADAYEPVEAGEFAPLADPDMAYQQVIVQPAGEDREIPVAIPAERPTASRSRSANPRVGLRQRVAAAMSSWEEPVTPAATAPFNPVSPDMTAPFDPAPADIYDDDLSVEPVANPELDAQANIYELPLDESALGGTIAMPPIDVSALRASQGEPVEEPLFEEVADADMVEPALDSRVQLPEIPLQAQQNAPLASAAPQDERTVAKQRLSSTIPSIDLPKPEPQPESKDVAEASPSHTERMRRLRADLPSMSGRIGSAPLAPENSGIVSTTGSFAAVSATGNIDPVGDELIEELDPEEIYVDDADDTLYGGAGVAEAGAYIASDYVRMPEKRRGLFGRRKRREAEDELSPQQWLGVSDDFDARAVGRARGDWTSFQENDARSTVGDRYEEGQQTMWRADRNVPTASNSDYDTGLDSAFNDDEDDFLDDDYGMNNGRWNGGAFSGRRAGDRTTERDRYDAYDEIYDYGGYGPSGADEYAEFAEYADENYDENAFLSELEYEDSLEEESKGGRLKSLTARFSRKDREAPADYEDERRSSRADRDRRSAPSEDDAWNVAAARAAARSAVANVIDDPRVQEELGDTYGFVDDAIVNEVWFVALGAGGSDNAGMEAFLDAHGDELRGAMVINLEGIGDGELVGMASEGLLKSYKPTTRMKRFLRNAGQATGIRVGQAQMNWRDSAATVSMRRGIPTITVAGVDGDVPIRYASSDDVADKLDEGTLKQRVNFILELLRTI